MISRAFPAIDKLGSSVLPNYLLGSACRQSDIKKPACGRLLVGDSYLFLINRNRLQQVRPQRSANRQPGKRIICPVQAPHRLTASGALDGAQDTKPHHLCPARIPPKSRTRHNNSIALRRLFSVDHQNIQPRIRIFSLAMSSPLNTSSGYSASLWLRRRRPPLGRR